MLTLGYRTATGEELANQQNPNAGNSRVGVNPSVKIISCQQQFPAIAKLGPSGMAAHKAAVMLTDSFVVHIRGEIPIPKRYVDNAISCNLNCRQD